MLVGPRVTDFGKPVIQFAMKLARLRQDDRVAGKGRQGLLRHLDGLQQVSCTDVTESAREHSIET